jgi:hypothetical protein
VNLGPSGRSRYDGSGYGSFELAVGGGGNG